MQPTNEVSATTRIYSVTARNLKRRWLWKSEPFELLKDIWSLDIKKETVHRYQKRKIGDWCRKRKLFVIDRKGNHLLVTKKENYSLVVNREIISYRTNDCGREKGKNMYIRISCRS